MPQSQAREKGKIKAKGKNEDTGKGEFEISPDVILSGLTRIVCRERCSILSLIFPFRNLISLSLSAEFFPPTNYSGSQIRTPRAYIFNWLFLELEVPFVRPL